MELGGLDQILVLQVSPPLQLAGGHQILASLMGSVVAKYGTLHMDERAKYSEAFLFQRYHVTVAIRNGTSTITNLKNVKAERNVRSKLQEWQGA